MDSVVIDKAAEITSKWGNIFFEPLMTTLETVLNFIPQIISALIVLLIGGIIVRVIVKVLKKVLSKTNVDAIFEKVGITKELKNIGITMTFSEILIKVVHLFLKLIVWIAVIDVLSIPQLNDFIQQIVAYLPNVIVSVIILAAGLAIANVVKSVCEGAAGSLQISKEAAATLAKIAKASVLVITVMAVLEQLSIAESIVSTLLTGMIAALSIGAGIAFGLGGKDKAAEIINKLGK